MIPNIAYIATVAHVSAGDIRPDTDDVIGRGDTASGSAAQGRVGATGTVALHRLITYGRVDGTGSVAYKRIKTIGRVVGAAGVMQERLITGGRIVRAGGVAGKGVFP